ncbi:MAG: hypothetical protein WCK77_10435 [Verrucomicrobiota bacterium]
METHPATITGIGGSAKNIPRNFLPAYPPLDFGFRGAQNPAATHFSGGGGGEFFPNNPFFSLAKQRRAASFGVRFSFFWQAVGAPVPCQKPLSRGNIGRKTNPQHNPKPNTT